MSLTDDGWVLNTVPQNDVDFENELSAKLAFTSVAGSYDDPACLSTYHAASRTEHEVDTACLSFSRIGCSHDGEEY